MSRQPWTSTDLRLRNKRAPVADTPQSHDPRGFMEDYGNDEQTSKGLLTSPWRYVWRCRNFTISASLIAALAVSSSVASIHFIDNAVVMVASSLTIFMVSILLLQQRKLRKFGSFRLQNNELRRQVYYLRQERERLHRTLDRLDESVADLHHIPHELHKLSKNQNAGRLMFVVKKQKELQEKIRKKINQQVMQQILTIVVGEDRDQNWSLRPIEVEKLIVRLGLVEEIEFNEKLFRQMLTDDPTVSMVMRIIRSLLERDDEYQHGTPIFKFKGMRS